MKHTHESVKAAIVRHARDMTVAQLRAAIQKTGVTTVLVDKDAVAITSSKVTKAHLLAWFLAHHDEIYDWAVAAGDCVGCGAPLLTAGHAVVWFLDDGAIIHACTACMDSLARHHEKNVQKRAPKRETPDGETS
ncbi:MAG: hypothetical protein SXV54_24280 [Chloroflexota bacterium]|nr:hypothetical protein [Chloroflexota bacterium]